MRRAEQALRGRIHTGEVRVPPRAVFIALIPDRYSAGTKKFVDDWALLEQEVRKNPALRGMELRRVELRSGENPVERARAAAAAFAQPGSQLTVGIALGVLPEDQAMALYDFWPIPVDTLDPRLAFSFFYIPEAAVLRNQAQGRGLMPTVSAQFVAWKGNPRPGVWAVEPQVFLPAELWRRFEERLRSQAGLEQAA